MSDRHVLNQLAQEQAERLRCLRIPRSSLMTSEELQTQLSQPSRVAVPHSFQRRTLALLSLLLLLMQVGIGFLAAHLHHILLR